MAGNRSRTIATGVGRMRAGKFATLSLTAAGLEALRKRTSIVLTKQIEIAEKARASKPGAIECDEVLFERLRTLRRQLADERGVPAYIIFSDVSLREMARNYPTNSTEFRRIPGVGEQKLKDFGEAFLLEIRSHWRKTSGRISHKDADFTFPKRSELA